MCSRCDWSGKPAAPTHLEPETLARVRSFVSDPTLFSDATLRYELARQLDVVVDQTHMRGNPNRTEAEQRVLDAMARLDEMQLQMTAETDEGDDIWVIPALAELARREGK
jgi:hypothetical protein